MLKRVLKGKTVRNIGIYSGLNFINSAIPFLLLPVLTFRLTEAEYAVIDIFNTLGFIFLPIVGLNIGSSVIRFYYDRDGHDWNGFLSSVLIFLISSGIVFICAASLIRGYIAEIADAGALYDVLVFSVCYSLFEQIGEVLLSIYRAKGEAAKYGIFRVLKTGLSFGITVVLVLYFYAGWESRVYTALGVSFAFALVSAFILFGSFNYQFVFSKNYIYTALRYSGPLILHNISSRVISYIDRFVILYFYGLEEVGVYSVAYQVGMLMSFVGNSVNMAWMPTLFSKLSKGGKGVRRKIEISNRYFVVFYFALSLFIYLFVPFIYEHFIGEAFFVESSLVLVLLLSYALRSSYLMYVNYMFYAKKTFLLSFYTVISMIFNVLLCWVLVPIYGLYGAAYATLISIAVQFLLVLYDYKKNSNSYFSERT